MRDTSGLKDLGFLKPFCREKGLCAICRATLVNNTEDGFYCSNCTAVYRRLDNGLLRYLGRLNYGKAFSQTKRHKEI